MLQSLKHNGNILEHIYSIVMAFKKSGNMGQILVVAGNSSGYNRNQTGVGGETNSISMFNWQYELQKKLQNSTVINYTDSQLPSIQENANNNGHMIAHDNTTSFTQPTANASGAAIPQRQIPQDNSSGGSGGVIPSNH